MFYNIVWHLFSSKTLVSNWYDKHWLQHIHFLKTDLVSKSNFFSKKSQETHGINKYPQRILRVSIPEGDSSITRVSWSLSSERLGVVCTNCEKKKNEILISKRTSGCQFFTSIFNCKERDKMLLNKYRSIFEI